MCVLTATAAATTTTRKMSRRNLRPFETAQLVNLHPEDGEEAQTLIPSLKTHDEQVITELLQELDVNVTSVFGE